MAGSRRNLNERLDATMCKGVEEFIGFQVEAEWENIKVPHYVFLTQLAQEIPDLVSMAPPPNEPRKTFAWTLNTVHVEHKVALKKVPSRARDFVTVQPHYVQVIEKDAAQVTDERYDHEVETDNCPQIALKLADSSIVAEDPNHPIAIAMAQTFADLKDKLGTEDVRIFVADVMRRLGGVKRLKTASIWYVPWTEEAASILPALQRVVRCCEDYGKEADLYITRMPRSETDDVRCATKSAQKTFSGEYRQIFQEIEGFIGGMFSGDVTRDKTLKERLKLSKFLRDRAQLYEEILGLRAENMAKALVVIEEATEALMDGAGEYRVRMKDVKNLSDKEREAEETSAKSDLTKCAKDAEKLMGKCRNILDPSCNEDSDKIEEAM